MPQPRSRRCRTHIRQRYAGTRPGHRHAIANGTDGRPHDHATPDIGKTKIFSLRSRAPDVAPRGGYAMSDAVKLVPLEQLALAKRAWTSAACTLTGETVPLVEFMDVAATRRWPQITSCLEKPHRCTMWQEVAQSGELRGRIVNIPKTVAP
jgi:hypothetical protein